eukprot:TRINITY_DN27118_c0_g1_i1.p1 TRINITY_DN27118_c0_g1~~TRINITY_DN27118_c0_g1_i1.p1  ORF type:complete len:203 (+),score=86.23 TRINITY_DN27118_c0_g1_i1:47-655(+)
METAIGIAFEDHVLVAVSGAASFYYMKLTDREDKIVQLDSHKVAAGVGEQGDRNALLSYIRCAMKRPQIQSGKPNTTKSVASFTRNTMAGALRSRGGMYQANVLLAGYDVPLSEGDDTAAGPELYWMDYLAACSKVDYACHGYGGTFVTGALDRHYRKDMTVEESLDLMRLCVKTVHTRLTVQSGEFVVKIVSKDGVKLVSL